MTWPGVPLLLFAATGSGLIGGVFFAFSNFIMKALARLPGRHGAAAMHHINVTVLNPLFFAVFFGTGAVAVLIAVRSLRSLSDAGADAALAGAVLYLIGSIGVTVVFNVPLNERLARSDPESADESLWQHYLTVWTRWNHVRTVASLLAAALFTAAAAAS